MKKPVCTYCGSPYPTVTKSELATDANLRSVRIMVTLCARCRHLADHHNRAAETRRTQVTLVLLLEELWALPEVPEPARESQVCPKCHNHWDTPVHYYSCERKTWP